MLYVATHFSYSFGEWPSNCKKEENKKDVIVIKILYYHHNQIFAYLKVKAIV